MSQNVARLSKIFNKIQERENDISSNSQMLKEAMVQIIKNDSFLHIINMLILRKSKSIPNSVANFIRQIIRKLIKDRLENIVDSIMDYLCQMIHSPSTKVRKNVLQFIYMFFNNSSKLITEEHMLVISECLFDKSNSVRNTACKLSFNYTEIIINEKRTTIRDILKNMLRCEKSNKTRLLIMKNLSIDSSTINSFVERAIDSSETVRNGFYKFGIFSKCFDFLLTSSEEFQAQLLFLFQISFRQQKSLMTSYLLKHVTIDDFVLLFKSKDFEYKEMINVYLVNGNELRNNTADFSFLKIYYKFIESKYSMDKLELIELNTLLKKNTFKVFPILEFYDIVTDEDRKSVIEFIKEVVLVENIDEIVDQEDVDKLLKVCRKIYYLDEDKFIKFIATLTYKSLTVNLEFATKAIISIFNYKEKFISFERLQKAIVDEIVLPGLNDDSKKKRFVDLLYNYLINSDNLSFSKYIEYFRNIEGEKCKITEGMCDFFLLGRLEQKDLDFLDELKDDQIDENMLVLVCKLKLSKRFISGSKFWILYLLKGFYSTENKYLQQYLACFFYEFFTQFGVSELIETFNEILCQLSENKIKFFEQTLYWLEINTKTKNSMLYLLLDKIISSLVPDDLTNYKLQIQMIRKILFSYFYTEEEINLLISKLEHIKEIPKVSEFIDKLSLLENNK